MDRYLAENLDRVRKNQTCSSLIGKTVTGRGQGKTMTCQITESGLLAAQHLGGPGACASLQKAVVSGGGGAADKLGTSVGYYTCRHGGKPVPGKCTPAPYDPNVQQGTLTQQQVESHEESGVPVSSQGTDEGLINTVIFSMMLMAEQLTANMAIQVQGIGKLFDAKHQLETQRLFQEKLSEAHKDYQPSEQMCTFGTVTRDLVATERSANLTRAALGQSLLQRELGAGDSKGATPLSDSLSRIAMFRKNFCNKSDNSNGLQLLCPNAVPPERQNADINYTQTVDQPLSLEINLNDTTTTKDEEAVFALIDNLFMHDPLPRLPPGALDNPRFRYHYLNLRSLMAMRGVVRASISNIIALKSESPNDPASPGATAAPYLRALLKEFGIPDDEIQKLLGNKPSYHAQMELLTKKIYQNPSFYTNLYDKPANVDRIRAAMRAVKLMQDRDIQAALHRREMLLSMMLELRLRQQAEAVYNAAEAAMFEGP